MKYEFVTADVFTGRAFGGNPLAVLPTATGLSEQAMQLLAQEFNLSETVFVLPPYDDRHTRRLRIFTPRAELPFAGHPTVGAAHILADLGEIRLTSDVTTITFEEPVGVVPVAIRSKDDKPIFCQLSVAKLPESGPAPPPAELLADMLSLNAAEILSDDYAPEAVSCGQPMLLVPVRTREALSRARLNRERWASVLGDFWATEVYPFYCELDADVIHARMFAPGLGIDEDPATGSAAGPLGGYLAARDATSSGMLEWTIEQGRDMGRPSRLELEVDKEAGEVSAVRVGGNSVVVSHGTIDVPDGV